MTDLQFNDQSAVASRLRMARRSQRLTQGEAAEQIGMSRTTLVAIEKGDRPVRPSELVQLSGLYGQSVNELLRPTELSEDFGAQFRLPLESIVAGGDLEHCVAQLGRLADNYKELERVANAPLPQRYPPEASIGGLSPEAAGESVAMAERNRLGLGDGPVSDLRELLESDVGLRIFYLPLPSKVAGLFIHSSRLGSCIAVNANHPFERQRWSLAHEYAHFLAQRSTTEVTLLHAYQRVPATERFADAFAGNFLMPAVGLKRRFHEIRQARSEGVTPADLLVLSDRYQVSLEALARTLQSLGLLRPSTWELLSSSGFRVNEARELLELAARPADRELLPLRYRYLAAQCLASGEISEGQFAKFLQLDRVRARQLAMRLANRIGLDESGEITNVTLDADKHLESAS